jgi:long-chain acyl-CoA synthetase
MLYDLWRNVATQRRDQLALREAASGRAWTFGDLFTVGEAIRVGAGEFVFPQGQSAEFILAVLAAWRAGKIVCPLERGQPPPFGGGARRTGRAPGPDAAAGVYGTTRPAGIVHLKTTSATTGAPRLVALTAAQLAADADNIVATMGLRPEWPNLGVISLAHSYGFSNLVTPLLLHGIPLILAPAPWPEGVRRAVAGEPAVTLPAVPALWRAWHDADAIPPNVKLAISAGAPLPLALERDVFDRRGLKLHNFYGASECGGIAYDASETPRADAACAGTPMQNVSLSVAEDGCLAVRSRAVAAGYWEVPKPDEPAGRAGTAAPAPAGTGSEAPARSNLGGGCFHTSDLAEILDGRVFLRGRAGDRINVAGRKVAPEAIEQALLTHPQVAECLVFGIPSRDAQRTEEIVAVVASRASEANLRRFAGDTLPAWQTPRHWWFVESLAPNARGKLSRAEWRERWFAQTGRAKMTT